MGGIKTFGIMLGTFVVVYLITPYAVQLLTGWLTVSHPDRVQLGFAILATIAVHSMLRRLLGEQMSRL